MQAGSKDCWIVQRTASKLTCTSIKWLLTVYLIGARNSDKEKWRIERTATVFLLISCRETWRRAVPMFRFNLASSMTAERWPVYPSWPEPGSARVTHQGYEVLKLINQAEVTQIPYTAVSTKTKLPGTDTQVLRIIPVWTWKRREFKNSIPQRRYLPEEECGQKDTHLHTHKHTHAHPSNTNLWKIKSRYLDFPCLKIHQVIISLSHLLLKEVHCT